MPEAAKGTSKKSAEAFVRYAVEVLNYTSSELDEEPLKLIASQDCAGCTSLASYVASIRSDRGQVRGGEWSVKELFIVGQAPTGPRDLVVKVVVSAEAQEVVETEGAEVDRYPAGITSVDFTVSPTAKAGWMLRELRQVSS